MPKKTTPDFLAVAFTEENNNHKFDKHDTVIAAVIDTNNDGAVTVGDTVTFGDIPHLNGDAAGTFEGADTIITSVTLATDTEVEVGVADGTIEWRAFPGVAESFQDYRRR